MLGAVAIGAEVTAYEPEDTYKGLVTWSENFDSATVGDDTEDTYARIFEAGVCVKAIAGNDQNPEASGDRWNANEYYYDLSNAVLEGEDTWTRDFYTENVNQDGVLNDTAAATLYLMVHKPDNATYEDGNTAADDAEFKGGVIWFDDSYFVPYEVIYKVTGYDAAKDDEEQTVTVTATVKVRDVYLGFLYTYCNERLLGKTTFERQITIVK